MISITIAGYAWTYFLGPQGIFNTLFRLAGWARSPGLARRPRIRSSAIYAALIWRDTGFAVILSTAGCWQWTMRSTRQPRSIAPSAGTGSFLSNCSSLKTTISLFAVLMSVWIFSFVL
jgi:hypothetical protein